VRTEGRRPPYRRIGLRRPRDQRGATAVELVVMAPVLVGFMVTVVGAGRFVDARGQVNDAAYAAARAASLAPNLETAREAGKAAATESLADRGKACTTLTVSLAGTDFRAAGHVTVEVTCQAEMSDVVGFGLPGTKAFTGTAVVPLEQFRNFP